MDASFVSHFIDATQNVFGTVLGCSVSFQKPSPSRQMQEASDVSALIGFSGEIAGAVVLRLPIDTASGIVKSVIGDESDPDSDDSADAIGEIARTICENAKSSLGRPDVSISCPQVVVGSGHRVQQPGDVIAVTLPCTAPQGPFFIEISVRAGESAELPARAG